MYTGEPTGDAVAHIFVAYMEIGSKFQRRW